MPAIRRAEMARAAEILGVQHRWLGFVDSGLPEGDPPPPLPEGCFALGRPRGGQAGALVAVIREFRPHVLVTYDENGGYPHPDHIRCHEISVAAFDAAGDPDRFPGRGRPVAAAQALLLPRVLPGPAGGLPRGAARARAGVAVRGVAGELVGRPARTPALRVTTRVQCADWFAVRDEALKAHATQIDPTSRWFRVPQDIQREVWPTEDYELVRSLVDAPAAGGRPVRRHRRARWRCAPGELTGAYR